MEKTSRGALRVWIYAAAIFGAHLAFMPLFVLLLPRRVEAINDPQPLQFLSILLLVGAIVASLAHFAAGHLSDLWLTRRGNRRAPIGWGTAALLASYFYLAFAQDRISLLVGVIGFQLALNCAFSPMGALLADYFSDEMKGRVAGLMNASLPLSSAAIAAVALFFPSDGSSGFFVTALAFVLLITPLIVWWPFGAPLSSMPAQQEVASIPATKIGRDFLLAWLARFLVQLGAAFVFGYLYAYLASQGGSTVPGETAKVSERVGLLSMIATAVALATALASGRISDAIGKRRLPLTISALVAATGLWLMGMRADWTGFLVGYAAFHAGLTAFLSIDAALVAQLVSGNPRRGALLGLMNLTNTLPSVLVPALTLLALDRTTDGSILQNAFMVCSAGAILASFAITRIKQVR